MKAKMKVKGPLELEFEINGSKAEACKWLEKTRDFLTEIPTDKVSLKVELKEVAMQIQSKEATHS